MTDALVTGGGGFIGSHLCESLLDDGREVICFDNFGSGRPANVAHLAEDSSFSLVEGDVRQFEDADLPPVDEVYHLASRASPADFVTHAIDIAMTNTEGTRNVFDYAADCDARVVLASTSEVYGDPEVHPQPESYNGNVNIRGPRACYDESKRFGETLAVAYGRVHGLDVRTARIFNTYGPRMGLHDGRVIPNFVTQALSDGQITVYGDGSQTRDFTFIEDVVEANVALLDTDAADGEAINVGSTDNIEIETLAQEIRDQLAPELDLVYEERHDADAEHTHASTERAAELLGYEPEYTIREGVSAFIDWYRENREWYEPLVRNS